jgi:predicted amidohydrolase YtcJ
LSADPLRIAPEAIAELEVLGTWLAGDATFRA